MDYSFFYFAGYPSEPPCTRAGSAHDRAEPAVKALWRNLCASIAFRVGVDAVGPVRRGATPRRRTAARPPSTGPRRSGTPPGPGSRPAGRPAGDGAGAVGSVETGPDRVDGTAAVVVFLDGRGAHHQTTEQAGQCEELSVIELPLLPMLVSLLDVGIK